MSEKMMDSKTCTCCGGRPVAKFFEYLARRHQQGGGPYLIFRVCDSCLENDVNLSQANDAAYAAVTRLWSLLAVVPVSDFRCDECDTALIETNNSDFPDLDHGKFYYCPACDPEEHERMARMKRVRGAKDKDNPAEV